MLRLTTSCYYAEYDYGPEEGYEGVGRQYSAIEDPPGGWKYWPVKRWEKDYQAEGQLLEGGAFLFRIQPENEEKSSAEAWFLSNAREWSLYTTARERREMDCRMEAVFYDSSGREVGRAGLETPE